jgi:hypothetical protein
MSAGLGALLDDVAALARAAAASGRRRRGRGEPGEREGRPRTEMHDHRRAAVMPPTSLARSGLATTADTRGDERRRCGDGGAEIV